MMTIRKKLLIIFSVGLVLTIIGLTTGILWFMIYSSILNTVDIKNFTYSYDHWLSLTYCFIAIIFNTNVYKLQAVGNNTNSYVSENIHVQFN